MLRVLDLTSCGGLEPSAGVMFPRLESVWLSLCNVRNEHLQAVINTTLMLPAIRLERNYSSPKQHYTVEMKARHHQSETALVYVIKTAYNDAANSHVDATKMA
ncbi:hypothetical protein D1007_33720 [Hordeum vulgare]|nr:hypothetical protein D1007_33720 [Hordeum vulgare]